jgi:hypothetical protein
MSGNDVLYKTQDITIAAGTIVKQRVRIFGQSSK